VIITLPGLTFPVPVKGHRILLGHKSIARSVHFLKKLEDPLACQFRKDLAEDLAQQLPAISVDELFILGIGKYELMPGPAHHSYGGRGLPEYTFQDLMVKFRGRIVPPSHVVLFRYVHSLGSW